MKKLFGLFDAPKFKTDLTSCHSRFTIHEAKLRNKCATARLELETMLREKDFDRAIVKVEGILVDERRLKAERGVDLYVERLKNCASMIVSERVCPSDTEECVKTIFWAAPRIDNKELQATRDALLNKYGKSFFANAEQCANPDVMEALTNKPIPFVNCLDEIVSMCKHLGVDFKPDVDLKSYRHPPPPPAPTVPPSANDGGHGMGGGGPVLSDYPFGYNPPLPGYHHPNMGSGASSLPPLGLVPPMSMHSIPVAQVVAMPMGFMPMHSSDSARSSNSVGGAAAAASGEVGPGASGGGSGGGSAAAWGGGKVKEQPPLIHEDPAVSPSPPFTGGGAASEDAATLDAEQRLANLSVGSSARLPPASDGVHHEHLSAEERLANLRKK